MNTPKRGKSFLDCLKDHSQENRKATLEKKCEVPADTINVENPEIINKTPEKKREIPEYR